jgi:alpha-beta hydrolase superfamily lysophospholipase
MTLAALSLAACAPMVQQAWTPPAAFAGPHLEPDAFISFDGARLGFQQWTPQGDKPWAVIVGVHGMDDYANAFHLAGPYWAKDGIATLAYDQRGFGRSPERGVWGGDKLMTEDLRAFVALVRQRYPGAIIAVAGESMGGSVAIEAFASDHPPAADRLVLISPGVWGWSTQPLPYSAALWLVAHVDGPAQINPPDFLTSKIHPSDNVEELRAMGRDPLELWGARADALYGLVNTMERASDSVGQVQVPVIYLAGAHDEIIPVPAHLRAAKGLSPTARSAFYPNGWHLLIVDKERERVYRDIESFIRDPAAALPSATPPIPGAGGR